MNTYSQPYTRQIPLLYDDILKQPHTLIAGSTGSGKSVLINGLIYDCIFDPPNQKQLVLIDPKRVELIQYKPLPHTIAYASEQREIKQLIDYCVQLMDYRYQIMQYQRLKKSIDPHVYIFVDEFADLITTQKRDVIKPLCRIAQLGRAANIHLILATQRPTRDIIDGQIKVNIDSRVALRVPTRQDSRNIINAAGAELLPKYGKGFYLTPDTMQPVLVDIPYIPDDEIASAIHYILSI